MLLSLGMILLACFAAAGSKASKCQAGGCLLKQKVQHNTGQSCFDQVKLSNVCLGLSMLLLWLDAKGEGEECLKHDNFKNDI